MRPRTKSRKGLLLQVQMIAHNLTRDWKPYRGDWQPGDRLRATTKRRIAELRIALDELDASL
jgi:hypothetical protein